MKELNWKLARLKAARLCLGVGSDWKNHGHVNGFEKTEDDLYVRLSELISDLEVYILMEGGEPSVI